jgi:hypothetical protein
MKAPGLALSALALPLLVAGCTQHTDLLPADGGTSSCVAPGPPIVLANPMNAPCAGALAAQLLRHALCSCSAIVLPHGLFTDGGGKFIPGPPMALPAAVGSDDYVQIGGPVQVGGALTAAGRDGVSFGRTTAVLGTLRAGGSLSANQFLSVAGDAYAAGDVLGRVDVGGLLHAPAGAFVAPSVNAADFVREAVSVEPPCNCKAGQLDLPSVVAARQAHNDDAHLPLRPDAFATESGPTTLELPCGEYYLSSLHTRAGSELELRIHGHVGLFVAGDVSLGAGLRVTLDAQSELDLVVAGNFANQVGMVGAPAAASVRLWVGGSTLRLGNGADLSALVHAPNAVLLSDGDLDATGSLFAQSFSIAGDVGVRFDPMVLGGGAECGGAMQAPIE